MKMIDLYVSRYKDYLASCDALRSLDDNIITGHFEAVSSRNQFHVCKDVRMSLAKEAGEDVVRECYTDDHDMLSFRYENIKFFALERVKREH